MATVKRRTTRPYCTCGGSGTKGFTRVPGPEEKWVHPDCMKVTKTVWQKNHTN